jgi:hypothetical protein
LNVSKLDKVSKIGNKNLSIDVVVSFLSCRITVCMYWGGCGTEATNLSQAYKGNANLQICTEPAASANMLLGVVFTSSL